MTFGSRLFQLQVQISFIVFTMDQSYFSGRHLLTVHLLSRYTSGTNLCLLVLKVAHKKKQKPVTSLDELNELKWTNPNYNWNIFYMYKIGLTADKRRQAYKGKFRSVWRNWWNYNMYVRGSWCSCRGGDTPELHRLIMPPLYWKCQDLRWLLLCVGCIWKAFTKPHIQLYWKICEQRLKAGFMAGKQLI